MNRILVYHKQHGLGFIEAESSSEAILNVTFLNGTKKIENKQGLENNPSLTYITEEDTSLISQRKYDLFFAYATKSGINDLETDFQSIIIRDKDLFEGKVTSSESGLKYNCRISFMGNIVIARCSCPTGTNCKHTYKLLNDISSFLNDEREVFTPMDKKCISSLTNLGNENSFFLDLDSYYALKEFLDKKMTLENANMILKEALKNSYTAGNTPFMYLLIYCLSNDKENIIDDIYENNDCHFSLEERKQYVRDLSFETETKRDKFFCLLKTLFQGNYAELLNKALSIPNMIPMTDYNLLISLCEPDEALLENVYRITKDYWKDISKENLNKLVPFMNEEKLDYFSERFPDKIALNYDNISFSKGLKHILRMSDSDLFNFIKNNMNEIRKNEKEMAEALFIAMRSITNGSNILRDRVINLLLKLDAAPYYLLPLLTLTNDKKYMRDKVTFYGNIVHGIQYDKLKDYYSFGIEKDESEYDSEYYSNDQLTMDYFYILDKNKFFFPLRNTLATGFALKKSEFAAFFLSFGKYAEEVLKEEKIKVLEERRKAQEEKELKEKEEELSYFLSQKEFVDEENLISKIRRKRKLLLTLTIRVDYSIEVKAGYDKLYKVKDILDFLDAFKRKEEYELSRNHFVTCDVNDLEESNRFIYDTLVQDCYESDDGYDENIYIGKEALTRIIDEFEGIPFDFGFYSLGEEKEISFMIDENYRVRMEPYIAREDYISSGNATYYINHDSKKIHVIQGEKRIRDIIEFFSRFNGVSIERNVSAFIDNVYRGNEELISIQRDLNYEENKYEVELYFDMNDGKISVTKKLTKNNEKVEQCEDERMNTRLSYLNHLLSNLGFDESGTLDNEDAIIDFLTTDLTPLKKLCRLFYSDAIRNTNIIRFPKQKLRVEYNNNLMSVFFEDSSFDEEELEKIYTCIKKNKKFVQLKDKRIINIDNDEARKFYETASDLNLDKNALLRKQNVASYNAFKVMDEFNDESAKEYFERVIHEVQDFKTNKIDEKCVHATLRNYQIDGVNWMNALKNNNLCGILADDMGLGKTLQTITLLKNDPVERPTLIVCPKSLIFNWANEFTRFDPDTKVIRIIGSAEERKTIIERILENQKVIYITSYDSLRKDLDYYHTEFEYTFLDEAQAIKTVSSLKAQSVKMIKTKHKFALTGTPIENNVLELWSIFDFLLPGYLGDIRTFKARFENDERYKEIIAKRIALFILRRTKKDVLKDLPEKYERVVTAEMTSEQRKLYDAYCAQARKTLESSKDVISILSLLMRLRQICVDPKMFTDNYYSTSGKMELLKENIISLVNENHKILIFSQFKKALQSVEEMLKELNMDYYMLTGETSAEDRVTLCDKFNNDKVPVFLITLKAGGNGLNLFGADTVIHLDPWWNSAAQDQATDRAYRIGQKNNVNVIKIICENSIEEKVLELQNKKKDLIDSLISDDEKSILKLSREDIKFILSD